MKTTITVLSSCTGAPLTKRLSLAEDGTITKTNASMPRLFLADRIEVETIAELAKVMTWLDAEKDRFVIRGEPVPGLDLSKPVRRLKYDDGDTLATFRSSPRGERWVCIDFDKVPLEEPLDPMNDLGDAFLALSRLLPPEFHDVTFWAQWSSSAGLDGWRSLSAHLWFMLDRPVTDDDLNAWALACVLPIDRRLFNAVQPHFTASPIIGRGVTDPTPQRHSIFTGARDTVPINLSKNSTQRRPQAARPVTEETRATM